MHRRPHLEPLGWGAAQTPRDLKNDSERGISHSSSTPVMDSQASQGRWADPSTPGLLHTHRPLYPHSQPLRVAADLGLVLFSAYTRDPSRSHPGPWSPCPRGVDGPTHPYPPAQPSPKARCAAACFPPRRRLSKAPRRRPDRRVSAVDTGASGPPRAPPVTPPARTSALPTLPLPRLAQAPSTSFRDQHCRLPDDARLHSPPPSRQFTSDQVPRTNRTLCGFPFPTRFRASPHLPVYELLSFYSFLNPLAYSIHL
uniref:Uncharacterized protein n=1 Tax=Rangifer tarandus platyrhynchus TaxID=3082113 RepID=A0ACB0FH08_RANTA|nr:unnamed protein product [Rangifer tarandus platyrhynchus]